MSDALTEGVRVTVTSRFLPDHSRVHQKRWFFSYTVKIANEGPESAQLLRRHWVITHATGRTEEVRGDGVVGETPRLAPGHAFEYTSYCELETSLGAMHGSYTMQRPDGSLFDAEVAPFTLADPTTLN
ncbi:MAG: Co2+/Mg2+ efflux protein ApaG [Myxococcota bacterium]